MPRLHVALGDLRGVRVGGVEQHLRMVAGAARAPPGKIPRAPPLRRRVGPWLSPARSILGPQGAGQMERRIRA